jgi:hypothetical protein
MEQNAKQAQEQQESKRRTATFQQKVDVYSRIAQGLLANGKPFTTEESLVKKAKQIGDELIRQLEAEG